MFGSNLSAVPTSNCVFSGEILVLISC